MTEKKRRNNELKMPELLAPAGNLEKLRTAIHYGADAVYLGGKEFSLRAKAGNFTISQLEDGVRFAHDHGVKLYVTINILAHNDDFETLPEYVEKVVNSGVDGLIVSDPGVLSVLRNQFDNIAVHLSTQANVTNGHSAQFWFNQGVSRINLARELSLREIAEIRQHVVGELEVFVHGAICISYSGRCMLSNYLTDRDANRGNCSHPCRFRYALTEEKRPGQFFPVEEDDRGTYIFNSKDLCLLPHLPDLIALGVDSLKIEGRMKSIFYVAGVVRAYRAALDYLKTLDADEWEKPEKIQIPAEIIDEVTKTGTRGATENFFFKKPTDEDMLYDESRAKLVAEPVAVIRSQGTETKVEIRNKVFAGEQVEYMGRGMLLKRLVIEEILSEDGESMESANPGNIVYFRTSPDLADGEVLGVIRRNINSL